MRAMSDHTRLNPRGRAERLMVFNKRLQNSTESAKVLGEWNLDLDKNLVQFAGRLLPQEVIKFNGNE
jgi:aubergine-like protein